MAVVRGPFLALSARGQVAKSLVSANWRGVPYVRQYVVPSNPRTTAQTTTRNTFSSLDDQFKRMLANAQAPWTASAVGKPFTARNRFIQINLPVLRGEVDMANYSGSPGVAGGLPGLNAAAAGGVASGEIDADIDIGDGPIDWEQPTVIFTALPNRDPTDLMTGFVVEAAVAGAGIGWTPPVNIAHTFTGLTAGAEYVVSIIVQWTRADGTTAYGPGQSVVATATV